MNTVEHFHAGMVRIMLGELQPNKYIELRLTYVKYMWEALGHELSLCTELLHSHRACYVCNVNGVYV